MRMRKSIPSTNDIKNIKIKEMVHTRDIACILWLCLPLSIFAIDKPAKGCPPLLETLKNGFSYRISPVLYKFVCKTGYQLKGKHFRECVHGVWKPMKTSCVDIDECSSHHGCHRNARCSNHVGGYTCQCARGYHGDGRNKCEKETDHRFEKFLKENSECGLTHNSKNTSIRRVKRIVGGQEAAPGDWPWMALINVNRASKSSLFSGVLIGRQTILTLASLLHNVNGERAAARDIFITLGENDRNKPENSEQQFEVNEKDIVIHPKFNRNNLLNDLAVIKLSKPVVCNKYVSPICLATRKAIRKLERKYGEWAVVTGWGTQQQRSRQHAGNILYAGVLKQTRVPIQGNEECHAATTYTFQRKSMMCAGTYENHSAPCLGDNGSPLALQGENGRWYLAGLFSWSEDCAKEHKYAYFTRVVRYRRWLADVVQT